MGRVLLRASPNIEYQASPHRIWPLESTHTVETRSVKITASYDKLRDLANSLQTVASSIKFVLIIMLTIGVWCWPSLVHALLNLIVLLLWGMSREVVELRWEGHLGPGGGGTCRMAAMVAVVTGAGEIGGLEPWQTNLGYESCIPVGGVGASGWASGDGDLTPVLPALTPMSMFVRLLSVIWEKPWWS